MVSPSPGKAASLAVSAPDRDHHDAGTGEQATHHTDDIKPRVTKLRLRQRTYDWQGQKDRPYLHAWDTRSAYPW